MNDKWITLQEAIKAMDDGKMVYCKVTQQYYTTRTHATFLVCKSMKRKYLSYKGAFTRKEVESEWRIVDEKI
jgi:hypothetical protein